MGLSTQEQILIEQRVTNEAKSTGAAYLIWFFLGGLGGHRFYLGRTGSATIMLAMLLIGLVTLPIGIGAVLLVAVGFWGLVDAFLIPGMIQKHKEQVRQNLSMSALINSGQVARPMVDMSKWSQADRDKYARQQSELGV